MLVCGARPLSDLCLHFFSKMVDIHFNQQKHSVCTLSIPKLLTPSLLNASVLQRPYYLTYSAISKCFTRCHNQVFSNENNPQQLRANVEEAKETKTLAVVMAGFSFCWLPICIMDYIDAVRGEPTLPRLAYLAYGFLAHLSSAINPVIYDAMNRHFMQEYIAILKRVFCLESLRRSETTAEVSGSESRRVQEVGTSNVWW